MKKIIGLLICLMLGLTFSFSFKTFAQTKLSDKTSTLDDEPTVTYVYNDVSVKKQRFYTTQYNTATKNSITNPNTISWVDFSLTSGEYKIVTYSGKNPDQWKQLTTKQAALEWEKDNPDWMVLAGVNGDFFDNSSSDGNPATYEPTGNFMTQGDMYRAEKAGADYRNTIGFKEDGSILVGDPKISSSMYIRKLNSDGEVTSEKEISKVNTTVSSTGVSLVTIDTSSKLDFTGCNVYVCDYSINRVSTHGYEFVKGAVKEVRTDIGSNVKPETGTFYLVDKDGSLADFLKIGDSIKCEYKYEGEWADVKNSIGYVYQVLDNGTPISTELNVEFVYYTHPRTLLGFREDGSMVMMVADGRAHSINDCRVGISLPEAGDLLKLQGCINGYNLDGGGSTTLIVRDQYGGFVTVNTPSDGGERSDGNHVFVVAKRSGFECSATPTYHNLDVELNVKNETQFSALSNVKLSIGDATYDYQNKNQLFEGLKADTTYTVKVSYDAPTIDGTKTTNRIEQFTFITDPYEFPDNGLSIKCAKNSITIVKDNTLPTSSMIKDIVVHVGDLVYNMGNNDSIVCDGLIDDTEYWVTFEYKVYDTYGEVFDVTTKEQYAKTLSYDLPEITKFETEKKDNSLKVNYAYKDPNRVVTEAYVIVNGDKKTLSVKTGYVKFDDLDFENVTYSAKLVLVYEDGTVESEEIVIEKTGNPNPPSPIEENPNTNTDTKKTKKCGKKSAELIISLISLTTVLSFALRKRR